MAEGAAEGAELSVGAIDEAIGRLQQRESGVVEALRVMRADVLKLDAQQLQAVRARGKWLARMSERFRELHLSLETAAEHSGRVLRRVQQGHTARERVCQVLSLVDRLVALESCSHAVEEALASGNFDRAVDEVQPFLVAESTVLGSHLNGHISQVDLTLESNALERQKMVSSLERRLQLEIDAAAAARDEARLSHMSRRATSGAGCKLASSDLAVCLLVIT